MPETISIAIAEHNNLRRYGLERMISEDPTVRLVAVVARPEDLPPEGARPRLIVAGLAPRPDSELAAAVGRLAAVARLLVVSPAGTAGRLTTMLRAGAHGCVSDQVGGEELMLAIRVVACGGCHVGEDLTEKLRSELPEPEDPGRLGAGLLAPREAETLRWLADGLTHRQIGRQMGLTEATISTYVKRIRAKLNVRNKADLTRIAIELNLVGQPSAPKPGGTPEWSG